jgi:hypothetical protein
MRYKLALNYNPLLTFDVAARAADSNESTMIAHFSNDEAFLRLLDEAALAPDEHARLVFATMNAVTWPELGICCEEVSLEDWQIRVLQLAPMREHVA